MSLELNVWRIEGETARRVPRVRLESEALLETLLTHDISIADSSWMLIGRQVPTDNGKYVDLLAIDRDGRVIAIELKRHRTPRDAVAQLLDYGAWVNSLKDHQVAEIYERFVLTHHPEGTATSLDEAFRARFTGAQVPESWNAEHELVLIAGELDHSSERIVHYLSEACGARINVVFFRIFEDEGRRYLTRAWLLDPAEVEGRSDQKSAAKQPWNGEIYTSFGHSPTRRWEDARRLGYFAAGGGTWYTNSLAGIPIGARIWVHVAGSGYVGVAEVTGERRSVLEFEGPDSEGVLRPIYEIIDPAPPTDAPDDELEYYLPVRWLKTVDLDQAIKEPGFFANQHTVARPRSAAWATTVKRLRRVFGLKDT